MEAHNAAADLPLHLGAGWVHRIGAEFMGGDSVKRIGSAREGHSTRDCEAARGYGVV